MVALCCAWFRKGILHLDAVGFLSVSSLLSHVRFDTTLVHRLLFFVFNSTLSSASVFIDSIFFILNCVVLFCLYLFYIARARVTQPAILACTRGRRQRCVFTGEVEK